MKTKPLRGSLCEFCRLKKGRARVILVVGEPGLGKSRMAQMLTDRV
jgi:predicted ATPase